RSRSAGEHRRASASSDFREQGRVHTALELGRAVGDEGNRRASELLGKQGHPPAGRHLESQSAARSVFVTWQRAERSGAESILRTHNSGSTFRSYHFAASILASFPAVFR